MSTEGAEQQPHEYEVGFLVAVPEDGAAVETVLSKAHVEVTQRGDVLPLQLAYPIQNRTSAYFGLFKFRAVPELIRTIDTKLTSHPKILRYLLTATPIPRAKSSIVRSGSPMEHPLPVRQEVLSNKDLEERLEEILK